MSLIHHVEVEKNTTRRLLRHSFRLLRRKWAQGGLMSDCMAYTAQGTQKDAY